jgi:hypothetical protein
MARPKQTTPAVPINLSLPEPLAAKVQIELFSELEGRIPVGAYKQFFTDLLENYFAAQQQPCPYCNGLGVAVPRKIGHDN